MAGNPGINAMNKFIRLAQNTKSAASAGGVGIAVGEEIDLTKNMPWDRLQAESDRAWEAFRRFRDMGVNRTVANVRRSMGIADGTSTCEGWAIRYHWRVRASAWDDHLDKIAQKAYEDEAATMGRRHAQIGMKLQNLGSERIVEIAETPELKKVITVREAIDLTKAGVEIERSARGLDEKAKGASSGAGTVIFNFNMAQPPKWAPKTVIDAGEAVIKPSSEVDELEDKRDIK